MAMVSRIVSPPTSTAFEARSASACSSWLFSAVLETSVCMRSSWPTAVSSASFSSRVPCESSCADAASCEAAALMAPALPRSAVVTSVRRAAIECSARPNASSSDRGVTRTDTSPSAMRPATAAISRR
jgi:hypothetical protein